MKKTIKQYLPIGALVVGSILLLSLLSYIGFKSENVQQATNEKTTKMQYVLVNEDKGTTFEGKKYSLGTDFVTLINQDNQNRWETTTRDIATRGIQEGQFDAQIIIPQDFSERLLSLQSISPEKALVEYQVREGQNEVTNQAIQTKVNDILKDFNQRIVQMYFSSIVGNLSDAQQNVNQMVGLENTHQSTLEKDIYLPFKDVPTNFTSVTETASILDEENKVFTKEQEAFVEAVKSLMETNNNGLEENSKSTEEVQKSVNEYADEANDKLDTSIQQFNEQFELQKKQLELQWGNDLSNYKNQYDLFNKSINNQLGLFYTAGTDETQATGVYADFLLNAEKFNESQGKRITELKTEIGDLEDQVKQLTDLRNEVSNKYFNEEVLPENLGNISEEGVRTAIQNLIRLPEKTSALDSEYLTSVRNDLILLNNGAIPNPTDLDKILQKLVLKEVMTDSTKQNILASYNIVTLFDAKESSQNDGNPEPILTNIGTFNLVEEFDTSSFNHTEKFNNITSKFTIDLKKLGTQTIAIGVNPSIGTIGISNTDLDTINRAIMSKVSSGLNNSTYSASSDVLYDSQMIEITIKNTNDSNTPTKVPAINEVTAQATYEINLSMNLDYEDAQEFYTTNYFWTVNNQIQSSSPLSIYIDKDQNLKKDLPQLFTLFNQLTATAEKITTIYADPSMVNSDTDLQEFSSSISQWQDEKDLFSTHAPENSIYWLYNNITDEKAKNQFIPDSLVVNYKENGIELYNNVDTQINELKKVIGVAGDLNTGDSPTLYGTLNLMEKPGMLLDEADKLKAWYDQATAAIDTTYNSWSEADKVVAESVITDNNPHPEKNQTASINAETESLVKSIQTLASSSKETAQTTGEAAAKVKDISPDIQNLKESTKRVETNANGILNNLDKTVSEVQATTKDNSDYAKKFDKVLANTKNGGADNKTVFNFLSNPIQDKGEFGKTRQNSLIPYYATLIGAFISLFVAIGLQRYMKRRRVSKEDLMLNPSRAWYNLPNVLTALVIVGVLAIAFGLNLSLVVGLNAKIAWFSYAFLILFAGTLLILGLMRQFRVLTLCLCGGVLGLFFMLTPLLGVATKSGTFINLLFRFSPLQNIQNGFTALLNGGSIGWLSYLVLVVLAIGGILLNFWVKPEETTAISK